jgi:hypothetical protein
MPPGVAAASKRHPGGRPRRLCALALAALAVVLFAGWWWGRGLQAAWSARQLVEAIERGDCTTAAKYSGVVPLAEGCPAGLYGLPDDLDGYSLSWDRVQHDSHQSETSVGLIAPHGHSVQLAHGAERRRLDRQGHRRPALTAAPAQTASEPALVRDASRRPSCPARRPTLLRNGTDQRRGASPW